MTQRRPVTRSVSRRGPAYKGHQGLGPGTAENVPRDLANPHQAGRQVRRKGKVLLPSAALSRAVRHRPATPVVITQDRPYPAAIRVYHDSKMGGSPYLRVEGRNDLTLANLAIKTHSHLNCMFQGDSWRILDRQCFWEDDYSKRTSMQPMSKYSHEEWEKVLDRVEEARSNTSQACNTRFVVMIRAITLESTHHNQSLHPPAQQSQDYLNLRPDRARQTIPLQEETIRLANLCYALLNRYRCGDTHCLNVNNYCFVDLGLNHFAMENTHVEQWAGSLAAGTDNCSLSRPPAGLYNYWVFTQGRVTVDTRRSLLDHAQPEIEDLEGKLHRVVDNLLKITQIQMLQAASTSLQSCHCS